MELKPPKGLDYVERYLEEMISMVLVGKGLCV
jgi:hypothetical protein